MGDKGSGLGAWRWIGLGAGIAAFMAIAFIPSELHRIEGYGSRPAFAAATAALMAVWWLTEALPISWTACVPLLLYPSLNVFGGGFLPSLGTTAVRFVDAYVFLFLGGMMIGASMQQWNLHRRIALHIMRVVGTEPKRLLLGVILAAAVCSLWISNTATAVMMLPIAMALVGQLERASGGKKLWHFGTALMLAVAYGCNVGGIGTKIGTPPNSIFCEMALERAGVDVSFGMFLAMGLPFVVLFIPVVWMVLWRRGRRDDLGKAQGREVIVGELAAMGPMSGGEKKVALVFLSAAALWIAGDFIRPEGLRGKNYEAAVAMSAALALMLLRSLSMASIRKIPWGTLVLLGGSFALAGGVGKSGLSKWLGAMLQSFSDLHLFWQIGLVALATVIFSAVASNTGTAAVLLTVLRPSMPLLSTTAIASSCDFMLPAGTPPNAIVFGSGYIRLPVMMRTGFLLDLIAVVMITLYAYLYVRVLFA